MLTSIFRSAIFDDSKVAEREPIVQCVQIKPLPPQQNNQERFRAVFSDISNYVQTMLATRRFYLVSSLLFCDLRSICPVNQYGYIRSESPRHKWSSSQRMFRSPQVFPSKCCQGQEVCLSCGKLVQDTDSIES